MSSHEADSGQTPVKTLPSPCGRYICRYQLNIPIEIIDSDDPAIKAVYAFTTIC